MVVRWFATKQLAFAGLLTFSAPNIATLAIMVVILAGTSLAARRMLSY
mgnify:CR=1 FL=1